jgi:hypothetical protein
MSDSGLYHLQLQGRVDEREINALSPLQVTLERAEPADTWLSVWTDQSGLMGLLRYLHGRGLAIIRVERREGPPPI